MKKHLILIFFLLITIAYATLATAWTPPSNGNFYNVYALYNVTNITAQYVFENGTRACTASNGLCDVNDDVWNLTGSSWLYNNSDILEWNQTKGDARYYTISSADATFITLANEGNLDVNSSDFWDIYDVPSDIEDLLLIPCGNITGTSSDLCTLADTTYSAGTGIILTGTTFSLNTSYTDILYYPQSTADSLFIAQADEANLDVNSADFWDSIDTPSDFTTVTASSFITASEFNGSLNWSMLQNYPSACSTGETLTAIGDTLTCSAISITESQISDLTPHTNLSESNVEGYIFDADNTGSLTTTGDIFAANFNATNDICIDGGNCLSEAGSGSGDITSVTTNATSGLQGGALSGAVDLYINSTYLNATIDDRDTNANTICSGTTTYLDGEGNCDDISSVYQAAGTYAGTGTCAAGTVVQNTTTGGVQCVTDADTTYSAGGTLLDLTGTTFSINEGTLTDTYLCTYSSSGTQLVCNTDPATYSPVAGSTSIVTVGTVTTGTWQGTSIADAYVDNAITVSGGTIGSNSISGTLTTTATLTVGDGGDAVNFDTSTWDVTAGNFSGVVETAYANGGRIYDNSTCVVIWGQSSRLEVC